MKARTKPKVKPPIISPDLLRQIHLKANEEQIRLQTTRQIALAMAQVLIDDYAWTPEQVTEMTAKIVQRVRANVGIGQVPQTTAVDAATEPL